MLTDPGGVTGFRLMARAGVSENASLAAKTLLAPASVVFKKALLLKPEVSCFTDLVFSVLIPLIAIL